MRNLIPLKDVVQFHYGSALKAEDRDESGEFSVFGSNGPVGRHSQRLVDHPTIIIGRKGSVGSVNYAENGGWPIDTAYYTEILDNRQLHLRYLYYALNQAGLERHTIVTSIPGLNREALYRTLIPLPPLPEQRRIAEILDKADAIRRKRRDGLHVEELVKSIFNEMFGNQLEGSTSEGTHFGEVVDRITYGFTCPMDHVEAGIPIITGKNVRDGFIDYDNVHYARQDQYDALTAKSKPQCGDLLIIKDGAIRGRCAIFDKPFPICINQSVCLVQPNRDLVTSEFLYGYLTSTVVRRKIDAMDKGVAMPHLQITELAKFPLKLPSLRHQEDFGERYRKALRLGNQLKAASSQVNNLFNSLVQRAFRGEL